MIVTEISSIDSKKRRIRLDSGYAFPLYLSEVRRYKITENAELDEEQYSEIHSMLITRVKNRILFLLGDSDKSTYAVRSKIKSAGYPDDIIDCAIESLTEYGYLDDERFTRNYIESMRDCHGKSRREIINILRSKGISSDLIEKENFVLKLKCGEFDFDEYFLAVKALRKKHIDVNMIEQLDLKSRSSLYNFLIRKGFDRSVCNKIFNNSF